MNGYLEGVGFFEQNLNLLKFFEKTQGEFNVPVGTYKIQDL